MKTKFTLEITLGNEAMQTRYDVEGAVRQLGRNIAYMSDPPQAGDSGSIRDDNGNLVGHWAVQDVI